MTRNRSTNPTHGGAEAAGIDQLDPSTQHSIRTTVDLAQELGAENIIELAGELLEDLDHLIANIHKCLNASEFTDAGRHAHSLKGTTAIFALETINSTAATIEAHCAQGNPEEALKSATELEAAGTQAKQIILLAIKHLNDPEQFPLQ